MDHATSASDHHQCCRRRRPALATVLAMLALVVAVGGTSYAAGQIDGKNLVNKSVTGKKLKADTVKGAKIDESTLAKVPSAATADKATSATFATTAGSANTAGLANALPDGLVGNAELGAITLRSADTDITTGNGDIQDVDCLAGETRVGGGAFWQGVTWNAANNQNLHLVYSQPDTTGWTARGWNGSGATRTFVVQVLCLAP